MLPVGDGVLEPDLDFLLVVFVVFNTCVSLDVRLSEGSTAGTEATYVSGVCVGVELYLRRQNRNKNSITMSVSNFLLCNSVY